MAIESRSIPTLPEDLERIRVFAEKDFDERVDGLRDMIGCMCREHMRQWLIRQPNVTDLQYEDIMGSQYFVFTHRGRTYEINEHFFQSPKRDREMSYNSYYDVTWRMKRLVQPLIDLIELNDQLEQICRSLDISEAAEERFTKETACPTTSRMSMTG